MAENYPGNSNKQKAESAKPQRRAPIPVVNTPVKVTRPSLGLRIRETFVGGDARSVASGVFFDVVIPALKAMLYDGVTTSTDRMLYGGDGGSPRSNARRASSAGGTIDYHAISQTMKKKKVNERYPGRDFEGNGGSNARTAPDSIVAATRAEAEKIVIELQQYINDYEWVSRAEFLGLAGLTGEFTDEKWGWNSIDGYRIRPVRDGFQLDLPRAEYDS